MSNMDEGWYVPYTPGGTALTELARPSEELAWNALGEAMRHMPYRGKRMFEERGYRVVRRNEVSAEAS